MRVPRIYVDSLIKPDADFFLTGNALKHVSKVLRLRAGAEVLLFDGTGGEWRATLETVHSDHAQARLLEHLDINPEAPLRWELVQGISRGERMDYTLQKSVELGVAAIHPVETKRTVVKLDADRAAKRRAHWQGVVTSAAEQSGRTRLPSVSEITSLHEFLSNHSDGLLLLLDPEAEKHVDDLPVESPERVFLLAGPEGGFEDAEREAIYRAGAQGIRLGPRILRTETAAVVAAALLLARWGDY
ncbi:MAG TPA: 16S rRNA (uracil(1498)-N(3))-methyltransferase [Gammaproteobacteria bacterium]